MNLKKLLADALFLDARVYHYRSCGYDEASAYALASQDLAEPAARLCSQRRSDGTAGKIKRTLQRIDGRAGRTPPQTARGKPMDI